jgi:hypothetical protein
MNAARVSLYVLDTGPLITLAAAESLDYLLYPNVAVVIPVVELTTMDFLKLLEEERRIQSADAVFARSPPDAHPRAPKNSPTMMNLCATPCARAGRATGTKADEPAALSVRRG